MWAIGGVCQEYQYFCKNELWLNKMNFPIFHRYVLIETTANFWLFLFTKKSFFSFDKSFGNLNNQGQWS